MSAVIPCETHFGYKFGVSQMDEVKDAAPVQLSEAFNTDES